MQNQHNQSRVQNQHGMQNQPRTHNQPRVQNQHGMPNHRAQNQHGTPNQPGNAEINLFINQLFNGSSFFDNA